MALSFEQRLARENNWSVAFAERVVEEYKRFLLLARCAGHRVTPSDQVDQAWHLHLTYTRSYWDGLCGQVLGRPLHHEPTRGGAEEDAKFEDWYARTLESYRRVFHADPPSDIWPTGAERFDPEARFRRIDVADHVVVPRRRVWRVGLLGGAFTMSTVITGCAIPPSAPGGLTMMIAIFGGVVTMVIVLVTLMLIVMLSRAGPSKRRSRQTETTSSGCDGFTSGMMMGMWSSGGGHHGDGRMMHAQGQDQSTLGSTLGEAGSDASSSAESGGTGDSGGGGDSGSSGCGGGCSGGD